MKDQKSWMSGYLSRGWSEVFDPSWAEGIVQRGQITAEAIDSLLQVSDTILIIWKRLIVSNWRHYRRRM